MYLKYNFNLTICNVLIVVSVESSWWDSLSDGDYNAWKNIKSISGWIS